MKVFLRKLKGFQILFLFCSYQSGTSFLSGTVRALSVGRKGQGRAFCLRE